MRIVKQRSTAKKDHFSVSLPTFFSFSSSSKPPRRSFWKTLLHSSIGETKKKKEYDEWFMRGTNSTWETHSPIKTRASLAQFCFLSQTYHTYIPFFVQRKTNRSQSRVVKHTVQKEKHDYPLSMSELVWGKEIPYGNPKLRTTSLWLSWETSMSGDVKQAPLSLWNDFWRENSADPV